MGLNVNKPFSTRDPSYYTKAYNGLYLSDMKAKFDQAGIPFNKDEAIKVLTEYTTKLAKEREEQLGRAARMKLTSPARHRLPFGKKLFKGTEESRRGEEVEAAWNELPPIDPSMIIDDLDDPKGVEMREVREGLRWGPGTTNALGRLSNAFMEGASGGLLSFDTEHHPDEETPAVDFAEGLMHFAGTGAMLMLLTKGAGFALFGQSLKTLGAAGRAVAGGAAFGAYSSVSPEIRGGNVDRMLAFTEGATIGGALIPVVGKATSLVARKIGMQDLQSINSRIGRAKNGRWYVKPGAKVRMKDGSAVKPMASRFVGKREDIADPSKWQQLIRDNFGHFEIGAILHGHQVMVSENRLPEVGELMEAGLGFILGSAVMGLPKQIMDPNGMLRPKAWESRTERGIRAIQEAQEGKQSVRQERRDIEGQEGKGRILREREDARKRSINELEDVIDAESLEAWEGRWREVMEKDSAIAEAYEVRQLNLAGEAKARAQGTAEPKSSVKYSDEDLKQALSPENNATAREIARRSIESEMQKAWDSGDLETYRRLGRILDEVGAASKPSTPEAPKSPAPEVEPVPAAKPAEPKPVSKPYPEPESGASVAAESPPAPETLQQPAHRRPGPSFNSDKPLSGLHWYDYEGTKYSREAFEADVTAWREAAPKNFKELRVETDDPAVGPKLDAYFYDPVRVKEIMAKRGIGGSVENFLKQSGKETFGKGTPKELAITEAYGPQPTAEPRTAEARPEPLPEPEAPKRTKLRRGKKTRGALFVGGEEGLDPEAARTLVAGAGVKPRRWYHVGDGVGRFLEDMGTKTKAKVHKLGEPMEAGIRSNARKERGKTYPSVTGVGPDKVGVGGTKRKSFVSYRQEANDILDKLKPEDSVVVVKSDNPLHTELVNRAVRSGRHTVVLNEDGSIYREWKKMPWAKAKRLMLDKVYKSEKAARTALTRYEEKFPGTEARDDTFRVVQDDGGKWRVLGDVALEAPQEIGGRTVEAAEKIYQTTISNLERELVSIERDVQVLEGQVGTPEIIGRDKGGMPTKLAPESPEMLELVQRLDSIRKYIGNRMLGNSSSSSGGANYQMENIPPASRIGKPIESIPADRPAPNTTRMDEGREKIRLLRKGDRSARMDREQTGTKQKTKKLFPDWARTTTKERILLRETEKLLRQIGEPRRYENGEEYKELEKSEGHIGWDGPHELFWEGGTADSKVILRARVEADIDKGHALAQLFLDTGTHFGTKQRTTQQMGGRHSPAMRVEKVAEGAEEVEAYQRHMEESAGERVTPEDFAREWDRLRLQEQEAKELDSEGLLGSETDADGITGSARRREMRIQEVFVDDFWEAYDRGLC